MAIKTMYIQLRQSTYIEIIIIIRLKKLIILNLTYDYQAPIGEFGQIRPSFKRLRTIHLFAKHFMDRLCDMTMLLADDNADIDPYDNERLRYAVRTNGESGFLFINNYQDHIELADKKNECIEIKIGDRNITIDDLSIASGESCILPVNMDLDGVKLLYSTAQLLSRIESDDYITYVLFEPKGMKASLYFEDDGIVEA